MLKPSLPLALLCFLMTLAAPPAGGAATVTPFEISNLNPLVQVYGLPAPERALTTPQGKTALRLRLDLANHFVAAEIPDEDLYIDGETYRATLSLRHGLSERAEIGLDIPYIRHEGGNLDDFIKNFHEAIGKVDLRRDRIEPDQILFRFQHDGTNGVHLNHPVDGIGDVRLTAAWQLLHDADADASVSLRAHLKLPTGEHEHLLGSGSTDLALSLAASKLWSGKREWGIFGNAGILGMTEGDVLPELQRHVAGFGTFGLGWRLWRPLILKGQLDYHTSFYRNAMDGLVDPAIQGTLGGTISFSERTSLDLAVVENLRKSTSPDVVFHIALRTLF